jgi:hypothetical protein
MIFPDCPARLDQDGAARGGLPAEVRCRFTMGPTDGPMESAMIRCLAGHRCNGPIQFLTRQGRQTRDPGAAPTTPGATRGTLTAGNDGPDGTAGFTIRVVPGEPGQESPHPNSAPAYHLGRPARLWITAIRPRRGRTASVHLIEARHRRLRTNRRGLTGRLRGGPAPITGHAPSPPGGHP